MANIISLDSGLIKRTDKYNGTFIRGYESLDDNKKLIIRDSNGRLRYFRLTENRQETNWCVRVDNKKYYINLQETKISIPYSYKYDNNNAYMYFYTDGNSKITTSSQFNLNCTVSLSIVNMDTYVDVKIGNSPTILAYNSYSSNMQGTGQAFRNYDDGFFLFHVRIDISSWYVIGYASATLPYTTTTTNKTLQANLYI